MMMINIKMMVIAMIDTPVLNYKLMMMMIYYIIMMMMMIMMMIVM